MTDTNLYEDIAKRTGGDIYIGVVGPVRTGKSTFIKNFMEKLIIPNIENDTERIRAVDEMPQSAAGKTIMTTEPKFIPEDAVRITVKDKTSLNVRMIDCVGYIVPSSIGYFENEAPRMVMTPWFQEEIPFNMAAEIGTGKVINEHSTIGIVITSDGSITDIPREEYEEAEKRVITELRAIGKPFVVVLNCKNPHSTEAQRTAMSMENEYGVPVIAVNCLEMTENEIEEILTSVLYTFPIRECVFSLPRWVGNLEFNHPIKTEIETVIKEYTDKFEIIKDAVSQKNDLAECEYVEGVSLKDANLGNGSVNMALTLKDGLFYKVLEEITGLNLKDEGELLPYLTDVCKMKKKYERFNSALYDVEQTGYGIVIPDVDELTLDEPEIVRQSGKYGVRLRATAPSIHLMKADISAEVNPIVGSEEQSEELVNYLLSEFKDNPAEIWESNIFGKSLHELINEGLRGKLQRMPPSARVRLQETVEKIINDGCSGLICIIL